MAGANVVEDCSVKKIVRVEPTVDSEIFLTHFRAVSIGLKSAERHSTSIRSYTASSFVQSMFRAKNGAVEGVQTKNGLLRAGKVILCAGSWSRVVIQ